MGPEPNVAPQFHIQVVVLHDQELRYIVDGLFSGGTDAEGHPRALLDSSIVVNGSPVQGAPGPEATLHYTWSQVGTPLASDTVDVRGPLVAGLAASGLTARVPLSVRQDPPFSEHFAGDDLQLNISPLADTLAGFEQEFASWRLQVVNARAQRILLLVESLSIQPSPYRVPWQLLNAAPGDSLTASVQLIAEHRALNAPYRVTVTTFTNVTWQRRIVARPQP